MKKYVAVGMASALCACAANAGTVTATGLVGGTPKGNVYFTFDDLTVGSSGGTATSVDGSYTAEVSWSGPAGSVGGVVQSTQPGMYAAPVLSNGQGAAFNSQPDGEDTTPYLSAPQGGSVTLDFGSPQYYVGLLWGSVDTPGWNTLTLELQNGSTVVGTVDCSSFGAAGGGSQLAGGTYYVNIESSDPFTKVVASANQYAFEFDNVAIKTPEGGSALAMLGGVAALLGGVSRRTRK